MIKLTIALAIFTHPKIHRMNNTELGKIPPQAVDLEEAVLGAMLLEKEASYVGTRILQPANFYKEQHQKICQAIHDLNNKQQPIDIITVTQKLRDNGDLESVGGAYYISTLTNRVASSANLEAHARIVQEKFLLREQIRISSDCIKQAYEDGSDVFDLLEQTQQHLHSLTKGLATSKAKTIEEIADQLELIMSKNEEGLIVGVPTGFKVYDKVSGGHQKGHLVIYAARPGMGKTARMINEVHHQLKHGLHVVIHSIEMTPVELMARLVGLELDIPPEYIMKRKLDQDLQKRAKAYVLSIASQLTIFEFDKLVDIERETAILVREGKCDIAYLDYLQLAKAGFKEAFDNVSAVSVALKVAAKKLEIPFVCVAQLSRAVETRGGDKRPILSDLRGSGQIEQDADVVDFLYRPEYYDIESYEDGESTHGVLEFINGKMRGGKPKETIKMKWNGPLNKISDHDNEDTFIDVNARNSSADNPSAGMNPFDRRSDFDDNMPF
jgi:replicative DNA helicase